MVIEADDTTSINIVVKYLRIEASPACDFDYLSVSTSSVQMEVRYSPSSSEWLLYGDLTTEL